MAQGVFEDGPQELGELLRGRHRLREEAVIGGPHVAEPSAPEPVPEQATGLGTALRQQPVLLGRGEHAVS